MFDRIGSSDTVPSNVKLIRMKKPKREGHRNNPRGQRRLCFSAHVIARLFRHSCPASTFLASATFCGGFDRERRVRSYFLFVCLEFFAYCVAVGAHAIPRSSHAMHHCEAVSSKVINSFLVAGRSVPRKRMTAKELLASQLLSRQPPAPIIPDFFTPNPRRVKGKARAGVVGVSQLDLLPDELKQECARTWLLDTASWERFRFEGASVIRVVNRPPEN